MPNVLVAAIARIADEQKLDSVLSECVGLETDRVEVFTKERPDIAHNRSQAQAVSFGGAVVAPVSHGTSVPGISRSLTLSPYVDHGGLNHLKDIGISHDAAYNYNIAIDEGRSVVTYTVDAKDANLVVEQFRACGFLKIRRFPLAERAAAV